MEMNVVKLPIMSQVKNGHKIEQGNRDAVKLTRGLWNGMELGVSMSSLARKLGISIPSVSDSVTRGQRIADAKGFSLLKT